MGLDKLPNITTTKELAEFLKISESTIHRAVRDGYLKSLKVGRNVRYEKVEVLRWLDQDQKEN